MKVSKNFDIREFVSKETFAKWGALSIQFVDPKIISLAQFYKDFFISYFKNKNPKVKDVKVVINNWHYGGTFQARGYRNPSMYAPNGQFDKTPLSESQHRMGKAFDCDVILVFSDGIESEVDQSILHQAIKDNWNLFKSNGLTTIERLEDAPTWLHSDIRATGKEELNIVKA